MMMNTELAEYLIRLCEERNESFREASLRSDLSASVVAKYVTGTRPSVSSCLKLADHFGIDPNRLFRLAGHKPLEHLQDWREGRDIQLEEIKRQLGALTDTVLLPIYGRIPAGWPEEREGELLGYHGILRSEIKSQDAFWLQVQGDSFQDAGIESGDLVLIDPGAEFSNGDIVALCMETGECVIRQAYKEKDGLRLESRNPKYPTIHIVEGEITAYGVVTVLHKKLK